MSDKPLGSGEPANKTWLDILGEKIDDARRTPSVVAASIASRSDGRAKGGGNGKSRRVRFSDLDAPESKSPPATAAEPAVDHGVIQVLHRQLDRARERLAEAEARLGMLQKRRKEAEEKLAVAQKRREEAESRAAALEELIAAQRSATQAPQADTAEVESLRRRLAEAYEIISAIEQAYLEGERRRNGS